MFLTGWLSQNKKSAVVWDTIAMILASIIIYAIGVSWLIMSTGMAWSKSLAVGMFPFLLGDALKIAAAIVVAKTARPMISKYSNSSQVSGQGNA